MIAPATLEAMLAADPLATLQKAIVDQLAQLMPGVRIVAHPGKVDLSELVGRAIVAAPGVGLGWSRVRTAGIVDGAWCAEIDWTAYVVAEAASVAGKRVEKEAVGLAIGHQLLKILNDETAPFWGRTGVLPPAGSPPAELKPFFTIRDAAQGAAYYVVTWRQTVADLGEAFFPDAAGVANPDNGTIDYADPEALAAISKFLPAEEEPEDA